MNQDGSDQQKQDTNFTTDSPTTPPVQQMTQPSQTEPTSSLQGRPMSSPNGNSNSQKSGKKKLVIIAIVLIIAIIMGILFVVLSTKSDPSSNDSTSQATTQSSPDDIVVNGNTYFAKPKEINDLLLFTYDACQDTGEYCNNGRVSGVASYQIGSTKDNKQIIGYRSSDMPGYVDLIVIKNDDTYEIVYPKDRYTEESIKDSTSVDISLTASNPLTELQGDVNPNIKGQRLEGTGVPTFAFLDFEDNGLENVTPKTGDKIIEQNNKTYYSISEDKGNYFSKSIVARFGSLLDYNYSLSGEINASDSKADEQIVWSKGTQTKDTYRTGGGGCGSASNYSAAKAEKKDLLVVGKTPGGQTVYQLPTTHPLVKEIYEKDYKNGESTIDNATYKNLSVDEFSNKHAYFIIENNFGDYVVMLSDSFFAQGGCGKPVIYLYPQKDTLVNVAVGADVVISEPLYPKGGWKNVLAKPNGDLTYNSKSYGSLFWEGYGYGSYPDIKTGTVVKSNEASRTIRQQLLDQGMQGREIEEFMTFWEPRLPKNPYVRLTWLTKQQIDELAPLSIMPRPNTVIRTFLDFEGLDKPINLTPQKFTTPQRKGFTVTEWGGLLRNGL